jgi:multiple sugar transport system ATP-binding protein
MAKVYLDKIVKKFGNNEVVSEIELDIEHNEFVVLIGPSGCGKSTILRMIAGLEEITTGEISIDGRVVNELDPKDRDIAMVFQDYALYPHLNVFRNMSFGLEMKKISSTEINERVQWAAKLLNIQELLDRKPKQLSGGQRQRVAMGRAIVRRPHVFLFDEPLSNLDAKLRTHMRTEIKKLHQMVETTIIYVTHDQVEAMTLADRIVILKDGHIKQIGTPDEVFNQPTSMFVAGFIGAPTMNFIPGHLSQSGDSLSLMIQDEVEIPLPIEKFEHYKSYVGKDVIMGIRPDYFNSDDTPDFTASTGKISLEVNVIEPLGTNTLFFLKLGTMEIVASLPPIPGLKPGDMLSLTMDLSKMHLFDSLTEKII